MAVTDYSGLTITQPQIGIQFTKVTDNSGDWASVASGVTFYDKTNKEIYRKDSSGEIVNLFKSGAASRKRIIGSHPYGVFVYQLNFGSILFSSNPQVNISILSDITTGTTGYIRLYASPTLNSIVGATLIGQYDFINTVAKTAYFKRTLIIYNESGSGEDGGYSNDYVEYVDATTSILSDELVTTTGFNSLMFASDALGLNPYLIAVINSSTGFKTWKVEYGG
jgi:hypothetical protein